jgi:hypothetical protein
LRKNDLEISLLSLQLWHTQKKSYFCKKISKSFWEKICSLTFVEIVARVGFQVLSKINFYFQKRNKKLKIIFIIVSLFRNFGFENQKT